MTDTTTTTTSDTDTITGDASAIVASEPTSAIEMVLAEMAGIKREMENQYFIARTPESGMSADALADAVHTKKLPALPVVADAISASARASNQDDKRALRIISGTVSKLTADALAGVIGVAGIADEHAMFEIAIAGTKRAKNAIEREQASKADYRLVGFDRAQTTRKETGIAGATIAAIESRAMQYTSVSTTGKWSGYTFAILNHLDVPVFWLRAGERVSKPAPVVKK